ncbi:penicillin-binding protein 1A [Flavobacterium macacae]|uniref:Penicillin-binding protein n=1 Tax=Flavobacterium macacae TaxID=2488993 RepID=A0A3P3WLK0_9FLAO|nr:transglycosylase domain-containing protein [Flavobacterium macacae]RRJ94063.1 penicillin-binding protein [Flavobacterium macacae]
MATKKNNGQGKDLAYYNRQFWKLFLIGIGCGFLFFLFASWGLFGSMPSFEELENPESNLATEIISSDGETLGKFYNENRTAIKYSDLPKHLVDALISTEDERFYEHSGIDTRGTLRAIAGLGSSGGASTITQQLAKLLFHGERSRNPIIAVVQKAKEWIIATRLERQYTKQEIIAMYFNKADFVNNAVGIRTASRVYFGKEPRDLKIEEGAVLVGMLKNPSFFNPLREKRKQLVFDRRNTVLSQMVKNDKLEPAAKESLAKKPLVLDYHPESHNEGIATYFREYLRDFMKTWVKENPKKDGGDYDIYRDGLKIYTTIDSRMQRYAEEAVSAHMANLQKEFFKQAKSNKNAPFIKLSDAETNSLMERARKSSERWRQMSAQGKSEGEIKKSFDVKTDMTVFTWKGEKDTIMTPNDSIRYYKHFLRTGLMSMEPQTGHVKAWVGGINYKHFQYDHVGQGARQVGSTFKPFVYAAAIEQQGYSPCDSIIDAPYTIPKGRHNVTETWTPRNSNGTYKGMVTLKSALANSINTVSAKLIDKVGPDAVIDLVKKLGVNSKIPSQPSIALGAVEITVQDMVAAYSTFANKGVYVKPQVITRIEDKNGVVLYESTPVSHDVLNQDIAYAVIKLLEGVTEFGSGGRLRTDGGGYGYEMMTGYPYVLRNPIAGKTGTTQNQSDGWFVGMVPNLATGVWVGNEDRSAHFKSITYGQGAVMALPVWGLYMKKCYADKELNVSKEAFERPKNLSIKVDCWSPPVKKDSTDVDIEEQNTDEFDF